MTTLREAAQQALDDLRDLQANHNITYAGTISQLEAALAQQAEPVQRKPLTDYEIADVYLEWDAALGRSMADFARAIERAHKIGEQDSGIPSS